jgi:hypothetical protein
MGTARVVRIGNDDAEVNQCTFDGRLVMAAGLITSTAIAQPAPSPPSGASARNISPTCSAILNVVV